MSAGPARKLIKICGVTRPEDARLAAELGADLIGLNFHPPSPRFLDPEKDRTRLEEIVAAARNTPPNPPSNRSAFDAQPNRPPSTPAADARSNRPPSTPAAAARLKRPPSTPAADARLKRPASVPAERERSEPPHPASVPAAPERSEPPPAPSAPAEPTPLLVGVFVNQDPDRIEEIADRFALDLVQLHGDEPPEVAARFGARAIQVFRRSSLPDPAELAEYGGAWGLLFDVPAAEATRDGGRAPEDEPYGGTGKSWRYEMLAPLQLDRPALVAGGIRPGNARRALERSRAAGVDVCSGVESAPGVKDPERMRRLFEEVRHGTP